MRRVLVGVVVAAAIAAPAWGQNAHICPFGQALFGEEEVKLDGNAQVDAYEPGTPPTFSDTAVVRSNRLVRLDGRARVGGDAVSGGSVTLDRRNVVVTGNVVENAESLSYPALTDWILSHEEGNDNDSVPSGAMQNGALRVRANETVTLAAGDYYFTQVDVQGTLAVSGAARIFVSGRFDVGGQGALNPDGEPANLYVFSAADVAHGVKLSGQSRSFALIYAMRTDVQVSTNAEAFGSIVAKSILIEGNAMFHYRPGSEGSCFDVGVETDEPTKQFGGGQENDNAGGNGNNGVGNGQDPQPPGDPPQNDGPGTGPGDPGNRGGSGGGGGR